MKRACASVVMLMLPVSALAGGMSPQLLTSSAWCSFTYNKTTGYSHTKKYHFNPNGTYGQGSRGEGYSSGSGGSMASQSDARAQGFWQVANGELLMSEGRGPLQPVTTVLKRNSSGYPIIVSNGVEYSQCR